MLTLILGLKEFLERRLFNLKKRSIFARRHPPSWKDSLVKRLPHKDKTQLFDDNPLWQWYIKLIPLYDQLQEFQPRTQGICSHLYL
jgi:hypothetical protein